MIKDMSPHKTCQGCLWVEDCGCEDCCDYFTPIDIHGVIKGEYEKALKERVEAYEEIIEEMEG